MKVEDKERVEQDEERMSAMHQKEREPEPANRATATRELAKDLESKPPGTPDHSATTALFQRMSPKTFTNGGRTFKRASWMSRDGRLSWLQK